MLQPAFEEESLKDFEEELNRLFRTNSFNLSIRRPPSSVPLQYTNNRAKSAIGMAKRMGPYGRNYLRPCYEDVYSLNAVHKRSPLINVLFPSSKQQCMQLV